MTPLSQMGKGRTGDYGTWQGKEKGHVSFPELPPAGPGVWGPPLLVSSPHEAKLKCPS